MRKSSCEPPLPYEIARDKNFSFLQLRFTRHSDFCYSWSITEFISFIKDAHRISSIFLLFMLQDFPRLTMLSYRFVWYDTVFMPFMRTVAARPQCQQEEYNHDDDIDSKGESKCSSQVSRVKPDFIEAGSFEISLWGQFYGCWIGLSTG